MRVRTIDENQLLNNSISFLCQELGVAIHIMPYEQCTSKQLRILLTKAKPPIPFKPAIYVVK
jgi:hypothetical protein